MSSSCRRHGHVLAGREGGARWGGGTHAEACTAASAAGLPSSSRGLPYYMCQNHHHHENARYSTAPPRSPPAACKQCTYGARLLAGAPSAMGVGAAGAKLRAVPPPAHPTSTAPLAHPSSCSSTCDCTGYTVRHTCGRAAAAGSPLHSPRVVAGGRAVLPAHPRSTAPRPAVHATVQYCATHMRAAAGIPLTPGRWRASRPP